MSRSFPRNDLGSGISGEGSDCAQALEHEVEGVQETSEFEAGAWTGMWVGSLEEGKARAGKNFTQGERFGLSRVDIREMNHKLSDVCWR